MHAYDIQLPYAISFIGGFMVKPALCNSVITLLKYFLRFSQSILKVTTLSTYAALTFPSNVVHKPLVCTGHTWNTKRIGVTRYRSLTSLQLDYSGSPNIWCSAAVQLLSLSLTDQAKCLFLSPLLTCALICATCYFSIW